jgi:vacuolar-type H+-ATPase subunit F/Vma7
MELYCIGDAAFCELFSFTGAGYRICKDSSEAASCIAARPSKDEIILVSENLLSPHAGHLEKLMNEPGRVIVPIPSPSAGHGADPRATLRRLLGGI